MRELPSPNGKKIITPLLRAGRVRRISDPLETPIGDPYRKIEVDIYEEQVDGYLPYLLEFYSYDLDDIVTIDDLSVGDWVRVTYITSSKKNRTTTMTYTTSTLLSIDVITKEILELPNHGL